ncbi:MAG: 2-oxoacid:ferredoxin oxidoreductase subunit beta [Deltaproteobacteria bacterium]|nr:2-oxoacid:ferredoxin oxidoreductase subunit beta [Deltaproteobacteria bacterium]
MKTSGRVLAEKIDKVQADARFQVRSNALPIWCPGCGYFGIHFAINECIRRLGRPLHQVVVVSGIGCAGRYPFFSATYGLHTVHGRTLPVATGLKLANPELTVFAVGGDGDGLGIGGGHLPHAARRDIDINYVLFDNSIYGLTKGQPSPSSPVGFTTKASPQGTVDQPLNASLLALAYGAGFVARGFAGDVDGMAEELLAGVNHPGFAIFHMYSSCVTFDKSFKTWKNLKARVKPVSPEHDRHDRQAALNLALTDEDSMGILYERPPA